MMTVLPAFCFSLVADGQRLKVFHMFWMAGWIAWCACVCVCVCVCVFPKECTNVGAGINIPEKYRSVLLDYCM